MSKPLNTRGARKGRLRADESSNGRAAMSNGTPMEVYPGSEYRPDPQIHSTPSDPEEDVNDETAEQVGKLPTPGSDRNRVLTSPLPLVVSAPEAIEKMEMLTDLIKEGRPDLRQEADAVAQAIDALERKALGDQDFIQHETMEGEAPAQGAQPSNGAPQTNTAVFTVGDRVVMALEDGEYQGEIQVDNGDGTYDIKTDQMATFRRVPAQSIAKPEMLQPIAPRASKKENRMPKNRMVMRIKSTQKIRAGFTRYWYVNPTWKATPEQQKRVQQVLKQHANLIEVESNNSSVLVLNGKDGEDYETFVIDWVKPKNFNFCKTAERPYDKVVAEILSILDESPEFAYSHDGMSDDESEVADAKTESVRESDEEKKPKAKMYENLPGHGYQPVEVGMYVRPTYDPSGGDPTKLKPSKVVKINGEEVYLDDDPEPFPDGVIGDPGEWTIVEAPKADTAKKASKGKNKVAGAIKAAQVKEGYTVVSGIQVVEDQGKPRAFKQDDDTVPAELYANSEGKLALVGPDGTANYEDAANDDTEFAYWKQIHAMIPQKQNETKPEAKPQAKVAPAPAKQSAPSEPAKEAVAASQLLKDHGVKGDTFYIVIPKAGLIQSNTKSLQASIRAGLKPAAVEGIFTDKGAAERFYKIVKGKSGDQIQDDALRLLDTVKDLKSKATAMTREQRIERTVKTLLAPGGTVQEKMAFLKERVGLTDDEIQVALGTAESGSMSAWDEVKAAADVDVDQALEDTEQGEFAQAAEKTIRKAQNMAKASKATGPTSGTLDGSKLIARGIAIELAKDETFAAAIKAAKVEQGAKIMILASKDGALTVLSANFKDDVSRELAAMAKIGDPAAAKALNAIRSGRLDGDLEDDAVGPMSVHEGADMVIELVRMGASKKLKSASDTDIKISLSTAEQGFEEAADLTKDSTKSLKKGDRRRAQGEVQQAISMGESAQNSAVGAEEALSASKIKASEEDDETDIKIWLSTAEQWWEEAFDFAKDSANALKKGDRKRAKGDVQQAISMGESADRSARTAESAIEASAFDEIPELEIGGGMIAKRKKASKKEGAEAEGSEIEVTDKDGKVIATYPDAFGDDTVMIIKFLRQVLDIKDTDDKKAGKAEEKAEGKGDKKEKGESVEDKPVVLPKVKKDSDSAKDKDEESKKEKSELEARAKWMEAKVADARTVVEAMMIKGHVTAKQEDVDAELLNGKTLRQAQVVAARKAIDREVMNLLAKPETELRVIKASLSHLAVRQVRVQASEHGLELANVPAGGLIHDSGGKKTSQLGMALSAAFRR